MLKPPVAAVAIAWLMESKNGIPPRQRRMTSITVSAT